MENLLPSTRQFFFIQKLFRLLALPVLDWRVVGLENIPRQGPLLVVLNHTSWLDVVLPALFFSRPLTCFAKAEVFHNHPFAWLFKWMKLVPIHRGEADRAALGRALQVLRAGGAFAIAPEGHRPPDGRLIRAKPGIAVMAAASHAAIVPMGIVGTTRQTFARNLVSLRRTRVDVTIGPPFMLQSTARVDRSTRQPVADELMLYVAELLPEAQRGCYADQPLAADRYFFRRLMAETKSSSTSSRQRAQSEPARSG